MKISVVIVTHNPRRDILQRTVAALAAQNYSPADWELIVVDNASQPTLRAEEVAPLPVLVRLVREERLGIAYARWTAIKAAQHEVTVFVDDDNLLYPDYMANAAQFLDTHPEVGALGGHIEAEVEAPLPSWAESHLNLLAIQNLGADTVISKFRRASLSSFPWCSPYGAGLVARTSCLRRYLEMISSGGPTSIGRIGSSSLAGCDDAEMMLRGVLEAGLQVAYHPALRLTHVIPARRLSFAYLRRLAYQTGVSWGEFCVRHGFMAPIPRWTVWPRQIRAFLNHRGWTRSGFISWAKFAGQFSGRAKGNQ